MLPLLKTDLYSGESFSVSVLAFEVDGPPAQSPTSMGRRSHSVRWRKPGNSLRIGPFDSPSRLKDAPIFRVAAVLLSRDKLHRNRVNAMAGVGGSKSLSHEHVAQVAAAIGTLHFGPVTVRIRQVVD